MLITLIDDYTFACVWMDHLKPTNAKLCVHKNQKELWTISIIWLVDLIFCTNKCVV